MTWSKYVFASRKKSYTVRKTTPKKPELGTLGTCSFIPGEQDARSPMWPGPAPWAVTESHILHRAEEHPHPMGHKSTHSSQGLRYPHFHCCHLQLRRETIQPELKPKQHAKPIYKETLSGKTFYHENDCLKVTETTHQMYKYQCKNPAMFSTRLQRKDWQNTSWQIPQKDDSEDAQRHESECHQEDNRGY